MAYSFFLFSILRFWPCSISKNCCLLQIENHSFITYLKEKKKWSFFVIVSSIGKFTVARGSSNCENALCYVYTSYSL